MYSVGTDSMVGITLILGLHSCLSLLSTYLRTRPPFPIPLTHLLSVIKFQRAGPLSFSLPFIARCYADVDT